MQTLESVAANLWTLAGDTIRFAGIPFPTRATVIRLNDSRLWIHSPVALSDSVEHQLRDIGEVTAIVCPNRFHHLYVDQWTTRFPDAQCFAAPGLQEKRPDLSFHESLSATAPPLWRDTIDQAVFQGNRILNEVAFFHRPTRSAIFTDLLVNLPTSSFSLFGRLFARFDQVAHPNGGVPRLIRWSTFDRRTAAAFVRTIDAWTVDRVMIAHGEGWHSDAQARLNEAFEWLR